MTAQTAGASLPPTVLAKSTIRWRPVLAELPWLLAFVPLTILFTWPLAARLTTELAGDPGDPWQNLWNMVWVRHALVTGRSPFFTDLLWHPDGVTLVFQTLDLPDDLLAAPLLGDLGPWETYNLINLWAFISSGLAMYALGRGTGASRPAAFFSGCAYTFCTYHFAHAYGHLHLVAMQWVPLYVLSFWRVLDGCRWRWAVGGGVLLALAALASWYYLLGAFVISLALSLVWLVKTRGRSLRPVLLRLAALCAVFLSVIGPLLWEIVRQRGREQINGEHPAQIYSADVQSFFLPNAAQWLSQFSHAHDLWSGNRAETAAYLGALLVLLVLAGFALRAPRIGSYLLAAAFGIVLSLGPSLHIAGAVTLEGDLPYAWIVGAIPFLQVAGVPVRLAFAATFSLAAALAPALDALGRKVTWWVAAPLAILAVAEHAPHAFVTSTYPVPLPMLSWADNVEPFAVLDGCRDVRSLWHSVIHGHPILGGYISRTPQRLQIKLSQDPVAGVFMSWEPAHAAAPLRVPVIDFPFKAPIVEDAERTHFSFEIRGRLHVPHDGVSGFRLVSDDRAILFVDGHRVIDETGPHPAAGHTGELALTQGDHEVRLHYEQDEGDAILRAWWTPPGEAERLLGGSDVPDQFAGSVHYGRRILPVGRDFAIAHLHELNVRYIVQPVEDSRYAAEHQLGLQPMYEGDGVRIYEVPKE